MAKIDSLFEQLVAIGGSDLHLSSGHKPLIRESGDMMALDLPVMDSQAVTQYLQEIMPEANRLEFEERNDTGFAYEKAGLGRFRANVFRDRDGPAGVFRLIPAKMLSAEELNLPKTVTTLCLLPMGLVVVAGPSGSGKSTTLAAMIDYINRTRRGHIITIEDPIEFVHRGNKCLINQREVHNHTQSFSGALRAALREDPDIVFTGEMSDMETIEITLHMAETGHLVFGTMHNSTAAGAIEWIIDAFPLDRQNHIRTMLAGSLKGVVAQTLCKRKPKGRVAAMEILVVTREISAMIRENKFSQIHSAMQTGTAHGMVLINTALAKLVQDGIVEPQQAYDKAEDKNELRMKLKQMGHDIAELTGGNESLASLTLSAPVPVLAIVEKPAKTAIPAEVKIPEETVSAPGGVKLKISNSLMICGERFLCHPIKEVVLPEDPSVYVILGVDQWGAWTVLDTGMTDESGEKRQAAERQSCWITQCPTQNIWFGLHAMKGPLASRQKALEDKIYAEYKPACAPKR